MNNPVDIRSNFFADHPNAQGTFSSLGGVISVILPNVIVFAGILFFFLIL
jgi:hypothetical protein